MNEYLAYRAICLARGAQPLSQREYYARITAELKRLQSERA